MTTQKSGPERVVPEDAVPGHVLPAFARWMVDESRMLTDETSPFSATMTDGDPRLVLIVGENASGKSLAFRLLAQIAGRHGMKPVTLSIRERTGVGTQGMENMRRAFIYGDEGENSTGATSAKVVQSGFFNVNGDKPAMLGLDEPEMGLSDGYAEALGELIGRETAASGPMCCGVAVVTHSRRLVQGLVRGLGADPVLVDMSSAHATVADWIASTETRSVEDLLALPDTGLERWRAVEKLLRGR